MPNGSSTTMFISKNFHDPTSQNRLNPDYLRIEVEIEEADYSGLVDGMAHGDMLSYMPK